MFNRLLMLKVFQIFLLILIIVGFGLIASYQWWVPKVVGAILEQESITKKTVTVVVTQNSDKTSTSSTSADKNRTFPPINLKNFDTYTYGNFTFLYPKGWVAMIVSSDKGEQFQIYWKDLDNSQSESPIRINVNQEVTSDGLRGVTEALVASGQVQKIGNFQFKGLNQNGVLYHSQNPNYPTDDYYAVSMSFGGLLINTSYTDKNVQIVLNDGSSIRVVDLLNILLGSITISNTGKSTTTVTGIDSR